MEGLIIKNATINNPVSYKEITEQIKLLPANNYAEVSRYISYLIYCNQEKERLKIQALKDAITEGDESAVINDFDPSSFLQTLKTERQNGKVSNNR